ncbi:hypothetical protein V8C42DRAFT_334154 [Trichoderma barbatum]
MKSIPLPHKRGPVDPGSSRRRPITWDETRGHDAPKLGCACRFASSSLPLFFFRRVPRASQCQPEHH